MIDLERTENWRPPRAAKVLGTPLEAMHYLKLVFHQESRNSLDSWFSWLDIKTRSRREMIFICQDNSRKPHQEIKISWQLIWSFIIKICICHFNQLRPKKLKRWNFLGKFSGTTYFTSMLKIIHAKKQKILSSSIYVYYYILKLGNLIN